MKTLGANSIRIYHVDAKGDHDGCMSAFADAGIYTLIDLDTFDTYILPVSARLFYKKKNISRLMLESQNDPWWNQTQYDHYAAVMDAFAGYDNTLGFFVGNEIIAINNQSMAAPFIKSAARDMKAYRKSKGYRDIPVGYSAADIAELRPMLQDYLTCGGNSSENIDFFALNSYEWCGEVTYETSGYVNLQNMAVDFPVPIFFSETGCNTPKPRTFADQAAIFGKEMVDDWSGSLIYEWIQEANDYGLISYGPSVAATATGSDIEGGYSRKGTPTPISPDFNNLKSQWATISPTGVIKSDYTPSLSTRACPTSTPSGWLVDGNVALPTLGETFKGSYTSTPTVDPATVSTATGASASASSTENPASPNKEITGMGAGLVGVMLVFTFWL